MDRILRGAMITNVLEPGKKILHDERNIDVEHLLEHNNGSFRQVYSNVDLRLQPERYESLDHYLVAASNNSPHVLGSIRVPTMYVHSEDDPIIEYSQIVDALHWFGQPDDIKMEDGSTLFADKQKAGIRSKGTANPNIACVRHKTGGHHAFLGVALWQPSYLDRIVCEWLIACVANKREAESPRRSDRDD